MFGFVSCRGMSVNRKNWVTLHRGYIFLYVAFAAAILNLLINTQPLIFKLLIKIRNDVPQEMAIKFFEKKVYELAACELCCRCLDNLMTLILAY